MRELRWWLSARMAVTVMAVVAVWSSWSTGASIARLAEPPANYLSVAQRQVSGLIVVTVVGAAAAAFVTARARSQGGRELWEGAGRPPLSITATMLASVAVPLMLGWLTSCAAAFLRFGDGPRLAISLLLVVASLAVVPAGAALGFVLGTLLPRLLAPGVAVVVAYIGLVIVSSLGNDRWWAGLGPALGPHLGRVDAGHAVLWAAGETAWFGAGTVLLAVIGTRLATVPRSRFGKVWWSALAVSASSAGGLALLDVG